MHDRINSLIKNVFDIGDRDVTKDLTKDEVATWDSLTHMDLVTSIEKDFSIQLTIDDIVEMQSLGMIRAIIVGKMNGNG